MEQRRSGFRNLRSKNPLLDEWYRAAENGEDRESRDLLVSEYAFAIPTGDALNTIAAVSPMGVVEVGAGTGYWARLLNDAGVDIVAFDVAPAPSHDNPWFSLVVPWFDVVAADHTAVSDHAERTLLMVWPTKNESWAADCLQRFVNAGGRTVVYVGEGPGGHTGDDEFHALLGCYDRCWHCSLDIRTIPCVCGVRPIFTRSRTVTIPHWAGFNDSLAVFVRDDTRPKIGPDPATGRRKVWRWRQRGPRPGEL